VLNGPTSDVWIDPWLTELRRLGVDYRVGCRVDAISNHGAQVTGVRVQPVDEAFAPIGAAYDATADHYIAAVPVEVLRDAIAMDPLKQASPALAGLARLQVRWMNGIMYYLTRDAPLVHGHTIFIDSAWALTSISQAQFWKGVVDLERYGDGRVKGVLSVDVSDWTTPGQRTGKVAMECSREEIRTEVWGQLTDHLNDGPDPVLDERHVLAWFLDPAIQFPNPTQATNLEPLLINTAGSWADRPDAATAIPNLMLAADYVRTNTDLATMEGANEAARRAVNAILAARGRHDVCQVFSLREPKVLAPARKLDALRWKLFHRPARPPLQVGDDGGVEPRNLLSRALLSAGRLTR